MKRYSNERREAVLAKLLPPYNMTIAEVADQESISLATLYNWRKQAKSEGRPVPGSKPTTDNWSAEAKLATVIETAALSESELSRYCRERGLYPEQIKRWKVESLSGFQQSADQQKHLEKQRKEDRREIKHLNKELRRKDKALAEAAALLVLQKKLDALWQDSHEDE